MSRAQRHRERADAARRLSALAVRGPGGGAGWTPDGPGGSGRPGGSGGPGADGVFDWFGSPGPRTPQDSSEPTARAAWSDPRDTGSVASRWRESVADRVPLALRGSGGPPLAGVVVVVLALLAVGCGAVLRSASAGGQVVQVAEARPQSAASGAPSSAPATGSAAVPVGPPPQSSSRTPTAAGTPVGRETALVVDVVGRVRRPGLVRLPPGSRVADAVAAAGGATDAAVLARINLARPLSDGEQVLVPDADDVLPAGPSVATPGATAAPGGDPAANPLDLNAATAVELEGLPGVGPVIAGRIVQWRSDHGRFASVDELAEVSGIGPTVLERLRPLVRV